MVENGGFKQSQIHILSGLDTNFMAPLNGKIVHILVNNGFHNFLDSSLCQAIINIKLVSNFHLFK
jgi:hypothetical protein